MQQTRYPRNFVPTNQQNFDNQPLMAPTSRNDSTVTQYFHFNSGTLLMIVLRMGINHVIFNTCT